LFSGSDPKSDEPFGNRFCWSVDLMKHPWHCHSLGTIYWLCLQIPCRYFPFLYSLHQCRSSVVFTWLEALTHPAGVSLPETSLCHFRKAVKCIEEAFLAAGFLFNIFHIISIPFRMWNATKIFSYKILPTV
jgi:hypothetical protein